MNQPTADQVRWTTADLELLAADEWKRYEIIDGELFVTRAPHLRHQAVMRNITSQLQTWSEIAERGEAFPNPGVNFTEADNVIPDIVWISTERLATLLDEQGHLTGAPELIVEITSAGATNERRDREAKLKLYSIQGVEEYWIVDRRVQKLEVYRRENAQLKLAATLLAGDEITSPLLLDFRCQIQQFFA